MLFTKEEEARIVQAIRAAERRTSGEIRVFVEDFCDRDHPVARPQVGGAGWYVEGDRGRFGHAVLSAGLGVNPRRT